MYCLEMRSTADWNDCRYRAYTASARKAEAFRKVPRVQFSDSGHGIVPTVTEVSGRGRGPEVTTIAEHVREAMQAMDAPRPPDGARKSASVREFLKRLDMALANVNADIAGKAKSGGGDMYARGLSTEGFAGGYAEALRDVDALLRHGSPRDDRGYWRKPKD